SAISMPVFIIKLILDYRKWSVENKRLDVAQRIGTAGDESLTTSELKSIISDAVTDATMDIERRLDRIERKSARAEREYLAPNGPPPLLDETTDEEPARRTIGRERSS
ncbi:MAG: hypothetical protein AAGI08_07545, partial [Bacteroidota bacterium]